MQTAMQTHQTPGSEFQDKSSYILTLTGQADVSILESYLSLPV